MRKVAHTLYPLLFVFIFIGCEQFTNPYDYKCPPEIWTPENLSATNRDRDIFLSWEASATHFDGFNLERSNDSVNWVPVNQALIDKTVRSYADTTDLPGSSWFYRIYARADKNQSHYCYSKAVCLPPEKPDSLSGSDYYSQFTRDLVYTISPVTGATGYIWAVPGGATLVSGQGTTRMVMHAGSVSGDVTVMASNSCGNSEPAKLAITICLLPDNPGPISGKTTVPEYSEDNIYSVSPAVGADSYQWQVPAGATINYGQGTTKISVDFGNTNSFISVYTVNTCGASKPDSLAISIAASGICNFNTFKDPRDGKTYRYIQIGDQVWMADNLAWLPAVSAPVTGSETQPHYYVFNYDGTNTTAARATSEYRIYGVLYNWPAAMNGENSSNTVPGKVRGVCPVGWHLPGDEEWNILENSLILNGYNYDGTTTGNKIAKSLAANSFWMNDTGTGSIGNDLQKNNLSCFSALPGGFYALYKDVFINNSIGYWWSCTETPDSRILYRSLEFDNSSFLHYDAIKGVGFSVRCIRD